MSLCNERDARGARCTVEGAHQIVTNSRGQKAVVHSTELSMWTVPVITTVAAPRSRGEVR